MRGIYNGEIRDRTHLFNILVHLALFMFLTPLFFIPVYTLLFKSHGELIVRGLIVLAIALFLSCLFLLAFGRELVFLRITKSKMIIKRPLLRLSPFRQDTASNEFLLSDIGEINITRPRRGSAVWQIISKEKELMLKMKFDSEYLFSTVELDDYFEQNGIDIKLT